MLSTLAACGADSVGPTIDGVPSTAKGTTTGTDTTHGQPGTDSAHTNPNAPTSNGPVASLTLTPHELTLPLGYYGSLAAIARDAAGVRVIKRITWRSSSASVVVSSDTGVVYAKSLGTAKIYASVDGFLDSTTVTVVPAPSGPTQPTTPAPVSSFNLKVVALGAIAGADTSSAERMTGATVTVLRIGGISGDTLATPETVGTATTDANGEAKFTQLPGGFYTIRVAPPSGSAYAAAQTSIAPPRYDNIFVTVTMRKP
jgi:hypothetical protein